MKVTANTCLALLRAYNLADEEAVPRHIERLELSHPSPISTAATFRYQAATYALLFDDLAQDRESYLLGELQKVLPSSEISLILNPISTFMTYGMPYKGKDVYLAKIIQSKQRLDVVLSERDDSYSRSAWQKIIKNGRVSVNGEAISSPNHKVTADDTIEVQALDQADTTQTLPILYIDDDVIVVEKPIGMLTHRKNSLDTEFTVADFFRNYTTHDLDSDRPGIVHRLDRDTSGVIIGARTPAAYEHLKSLFANRRVKKIYKAVVSTDPGQTECIIDLPIARDAARPGAFRVDSKGKSAATYLRTEITGQKYRLLHLEPRSGRTHQLRVHMAYLKAPIVGDRLYSGEPAKRLYLHAYALELELPGGEQKQFTSRLPAEFTQLAGEEVSHE